MQLRANCNTSGDAEVAQSNKGLILSNEFQNLPMKLGFTLLMSESLDNQNFPDKGSIARKNLPLVFPDEVKVISAHSDGASHLCAVHSSSQDASSDGYIASEWALLINVGACTNRSDLVNECAFVQMTSIPPSSCSLRT